MLEEEHEKALAAMPDPSCSLYYGLWAEKYDFQLARNMLLLFLEKKDLADECEEWLRQKRYLVYREELEEGEEKSEYCEDNGFLLIGEKKRNR